MGYKLLSFETIEAQRREWDCLAQGQIANERQCWDNYSCLLTPGRSFDYSRASSFLSWP